MQLWISLSGWAALVTGVAASASVDTSPRPGGVYGLKPGIYVQKGLPCGDAPNAAIRQYDGQGIRDAHSRACHAQVLSRRGRRFEVRQSCIDAGAGRAPRVSERQTVTVADALTFTLRTRASSTSYRYCPSYMLPADVRESGK